MAKQEQISLFLKLKDGVSKGLDKIKKTGQGFSNTMKTAFQKVSDTFKNSTFSAVALGTAISNFAFQAIASIQRWAGEAKRQFQEFEKSLTDVYTLLDEDTFNENAKDIEKGAIKIMQQYNLSIQDVNKAMFDAVSAGVDAADATDFLTEAARLAKGGVTDLSVAVDGMTSIINAYGLEQEEATNVANAFFTAQKFGKTTVEELSSSIGKVAPIAAAAGVSYQELLAATSQLTLSGISTEEAITALKGAFTSIIKPSSDAAKKFEEMGIPMGSAAFEGGKFGETMDKIRNSTEENIDEISQLIPNIRGLLAVTSVATKEGLQKYDEILVAVKTDSESLTAALVKQMSTMQEMIQTEEGKLIPAKLRIGKILSKGHLLWLKLANSVWKTTNIYKASTGVYGTIIGWLGKVGNKLTEITGLRKEEHKEDVAINKEKEAMADETAERDIERETEKKETLKQLDQDFLNSRAEMEEIAESARRDFENQKKQFDQLSAAERIKLLQDTLGKEKVLKATRQIDELIAKGEHEQAKAVMDKLHHDAFKALNKETIKKLDDGWKKHWSNQLLGAKLNAKDRQELDNVVGQSFEDLTTLLGKESIAAFRLIQGVSIGQALIKTYESAQLAFTALAGIPFVGPTLGGIAAGAAIGAGLARVEQIRRQRPPQAETGGFVRQGGLAEIHEGENILTKDQTDAIRDGQRQRQVINLQLDNETVQSWILSTDEEGERMERVGLR